MTKKKSISIRRSTMLPEPEFNSHIADMRYWNGHRWVGGGAFVQHWLKENGGIDNVVSSVAQESFMLGKVFGINSMFHRKE